MSQEVAQKLAGRAIKTVKLEDGLEVKIRKVSKFELFSAGVFGPSIEVQPEAVKSGGKMGDRAVASDSAGIGKVIEALVSKGMHDPKVWVGVEARRPKDQVLLFELSDYMEILFGEILELSGFDAEVTNAASFRDSEKEGAKAGKNVKSNRTEPRPTPA